MAGGDGMKCSEFKSHHAPEMTTFCALRRLTGTPYYSQANVLRMFDDYLLETDHRDPKLTREVVDNFMLKQAHLAVRTHANRLNVVRQFCEYLARKDPSSYIPGRSRTPQSDEAFLPYIFSVDEIRTLLKRTMTLSPAGSLRGLVLKTVYALLFCAGLRISEALALNLEDIHLDTFRMFIRRGKFRKERWIVTTPSATSAITAYLQHRCRKFPATSSDPCFVNVYGRRLGQASAREPFRLLLAECGIGAGCHPRLHDLRHSFAVQCLLRWYREGEADIDSLLPALATYMGHVDIASTQLYLHATPELQQEAYQRSLSYVSANIFMKGGNSDA